MMYTTINLTPSGALELAVEIQRTIIAGSCKGAIALTFTDSGTIDVQVVDIEIGDN